MIDYEKLKIIAYDFDDTLFAHSNHRTDTIEEEIDYLKRCLLCIFFKRKTGEH
mgnify:CR=1 FL=1